MKNLIKFLSVLMIVMVAFTSCGKDDIMQGKPDWAGNGKPDFVKMPNNPGFLQPSFELEYEVEVELPDVFYLSEVFDLTAGQHNVVGTVNVYNNEEFLWVEYDVTQDDLYLDEVHLYLSDEPFTSRLAPGLAPIKADLNSEKTFVVQITLASLGIEVCEGGVVYLQTRAVLSNEEIAYGGEIITTGRGAWFGNIEYVIPENVPIYTEEGTLLELIIDCDNGEEARQAAIDNALAFEPTFVHTYILFSNNMIEKTEELENGGLNITRTWTTLDVCGAEAVFVLNMLVLPCEDLETPNWREETAWGGNLVGGGDSEWYYLLMEDMSSGKIATDMPIYAGQKLVEGASISLEWSDGVWVHIDLGPNMELQAGNETVKAQHYSGIENVPTSRPAAGDFSYKGNELSFFYSYGGTFNQYLAIHLDVEVDWSFLPDDE